MLGQCIFGNENQWITQIESNFKIHDYANALVIAKQAVKQHPTSYKLKQLLIMSLAKAHYISEALTLYKNANETSTNQMQIQAIESICWGILDQSHDKFEHLKLFHLIGAASAKDAKSVEILLLSLRSSNALIRAQAVRLIAQYKDQKLLDELDQLVKKEKNWFVRFEIIKAIGQLQLHHQKKWLYELLESEIATEDEKAAAVQSLVGIYEDISLEEIKQLKNSPRLITRSIAPLMLLHLKKQDLQNEILDLLQDPSAHVQVTALSSLALLSEFQYNNELQTQLKPFLESAHPSLQITAAWALANQYPEQSLKVLKYHLENYHEQNSPLAACVLGKLGNFFSDFSYECLHHKDIFVRLNVALGLLKQQLFAEESLEVIVNALKQTDVEIMENVNFHPFLYFLTKNNHRHLPHVPDYPRLVNGITRIGLIKTLFIFEHPSAQQLLTSYLSHHTWGLTFESVMTLIQEGEFESDKIFQPLLQHKDVKIRVQAALAVAFLTKNENAIEVLIGAYPSLNTNMKLSIIEALGYFKGEKALSFLIDRLEDPFKLTKIVAASAIIHCIYH